MNDEHDDENDTAENLIAEAIGVAEDVPDPLDGLVEPLPELDVRLLEGLVFAEQQVLLGTPVDLGAGGIPLVTICETPPCGNPDTTTSLALTTFELSISTTGRIGFAATFIGAGTTHDEEAVIARTPFGERDARHAH